MIYYGKVKGNQIDLEKEGDWEMFMAANQDRKVWIEVGFDSKQRTGKQNSALHLALTMVANALNDSGLEMSVVLGRTMRAPWTMESVKDALFRPLMTAKTKKRSTTELTKQEVSEIYELMFRELGEKFGVEFIPFPSLANKNES